MKNPGVLSEPKPLGLSSAVSSLRFGSVSFRAYPRDHEPRLVHAFFAECEAILDLRADGTVALADRWDALQPADDKRGDARKMLKSAAEHFEELVAIWEDMRG